MKPKVIITNEVHRKIMHWINKSEFEVSGLGTLTVQKDGTFRVDHVVLLPQTNGPTHTDIEPEDVGKLLYAFRDKPGELKFWWHSHVNMGVFWSGTDMDTIRKIGSGGWFVSTVFNKRREMKSSYYAVEGMIMPWGRQELFFDDLETAIEAHVDDSIEDWDKEYDDNVTIGRTPVLPVELDDEPWRRPVKRIAQEKILVDAGFTDQYGFTQEERGTFAQLGWTEHDFDELIDFDVTPMEMLLLASEGIDPADVLHQLETGWTIAGVMRQLGIDDNFARGNA